jgi:hypothetical protein
MHTADRISLVGYSMPPLDLMFLGLLEEAVRGREVEVDVVNPAPDSIVEHLMLLGLEEDQIHTIGHDNCVASFVSELVDTSAREFVSDLRALDPARDADTSVLTPFWIEPSPVNLASPAAPLREVTTIEGVDSQNLVLSLRGAPTFQGDGTREAVPAITLASLRGALSESERIIVEIPNHGRRLAVGAWRNEADEHHRPVLILALAGRAE